MIQVKRLEQILRALGRRTNSISLLMVEVPNMQEIHIATIETIHQNCINLKKFYSGALRINDNRFCEQTFRPLLGRLERIDMQMGVVRGANTFADCRKLKEWKLEIFYGFNGDSLNFHFPELRSVNFSKVDEIDNKHLEPFLMKNPQLKNIILTRCAIDTNILALLAKHVPAVEEIAMNFRRSLVKRSDMQKNLKYLIELKQLKALNLDCMGQIVGNTLTKMTETGSALNRIGLFCVQWDNKIVNALANLKDLKSLHLCNIVGLNDERLALLSTNLNGLNDLTLKFIRNITMTGVMKLMAECQRLTTANLVFEKMTPISTDRYMKLLEAIEKRPERIKLTITLWGTTIPLKLSRDLLNKNLDVLEINLERDDLNKNVDFDFFCESSDGGYDLVSFTPPSSCNIN